MTLKVIISDSCCLIDLRKASLIEAFLSLPFEIAIPDLMLMDELLSFSEQEISRMMALGLQPWELDGDSLNEAGQLNQSIPSLTVYDCFAYVLAKNTPESILFTGDQKLRIHAEQNQVEVHGVLWGVEQMYWHNVVPAKLLILGLETLRSDTSVRIPHADSDDLVRRLRGSSVGR